MTDYKQTKYMELLLSKKHLLPNNTETLKFKDVFIV